MRALGGSTLFGLALVVAATTRPVLAAGAPLLVVVEAPPALDADAAAIRRAIAAELRSATVAPTQIVPEGGDRVLIVALEHDRITMSLRASDASPVVRVVPLPTDHGARLRAIAWLAGNLARDQVSPILAEPPPEPPPVATGPPPLVAPEPPLAGSASSAAPAPSPIPPPSSLQAPSEVRGPMIAARAEPAGVASPLRWSVSGSLGPALAAFNRFGYFEWISPSAPVTAWQISVQRRREDQRLVIGGALQGIYSSDGNALSGPGVPLLGANVFLGAEWRFRHCALETTVGAGPQAQSTLDLRGLYGFPLSDGPTTYRLAFFAQGTIAAGIPISGSLEGLVQVGVNVNASHDEFWFVASTFGLRYTLQ